MRVLTFKKPKKAQSTEDWQSISADGAPPGVYVPNMNQEARLLWKAKVVGSRSGNHQIEIRKTVVGTQMVVVVNGKMPHPEEAKRWLQRELQPYHVKISANGPMIFDEPVWTELNRAVEEAREVLRLLDVPATTKATLKAVRAGEHPLGGSTRQRKSVDIVADYLHGRNVACQIDEISDSTGLSVTAVRESLELLMSSKAVEQTGTHYEWFGTC